MDKLDRLSRAAIGPLMRLRWWWALRLLCAWQGRRDGRRGIPAA
jgi:hypothetical protein